MDAVSLGKDRSMRFVVIGTAGAGKTTFAQSLAEAIGCPCIELDQLYWDAHWVAVPREDFRTAVRAATKGDRWVIDGNYGSVRDIVWPRATDVLWLNFPRRTVFYRVFWRTVRRGMLRTELFKGNRESLRMAFLSKESVILQSIAAYGKNRQKFSELRKDPAFVHLQWTDVTKASRTAAVIEALARADCDAPLPS
jgi:adenylate kinase family enzyme